MVGTRSKRAAAKGASAPALTKKTKKATAAKPVKKPATSCKIAIKANATKKAAAKSPAVAVKIQATPPAAVISTPSWLTFAPAPALKSAWKAVAKQKALSAPTTKTITFAGKVPVNNGEPDGTGDFMYDGGVSAFRVVDTSDEAPSTKPVFHAMLNQTNIGQNNNKYYLIQLLRKNTSNAYFTYFRWGRVGSVTGAKLAWQPNLEAAKQAFLKQYKAKTKNDFWATDFKKVKGKYDLIEMDFGDTEADKPSTSTSKPKKEVPSKLKPSVQRLVKLICDMKRIEAEMRELNFDTTRQPLGKVKNEQVMKGFEILSEIEAVLEKTKRGNLTELSSQYYTKIPHNFGMRVPPVIKTKEMLETEVKLLDALKDVTVITKMLEAEQSGEPVNEIDQQYKGLNCGMTEATKKESAVIAKLLKHTHAPTHFMYKNIKLIQAFNLDASNQNDKTFKDFEHMDRKLLWHGTRITNVCGILKQGLRIAPPEAPVSGYMFGKGIYFADACSKSANYCGFSSYFGGDGSSEKVLFLADVAVGKTRDIYHSDYKAGEKLGTHYNSTKGLGKTVPQKEEVFNGALIPKVTGVKAGDGCILGDSGDLARYLMYNEYIVYDTQQVNLKYMCHVEFES